LKLEILRKRGIVLFFIILFFLSSFPFEKASGSGPLGGMYGGELRVALQKDVDLNPLTADQASRKVLELIYDSLARKDPNTSLPIPWLARNWTINETAKTILVNLREDGKWYDGTSLKAQDVVWTYQQYLNAGLVSGFTVIALSDTSLLFTFTSRAGDFLGKGITMPIAFPANSLTPKSSGPFFVFERKVGSYLNIKAREDHFKRPYLDSINYTFYGNMDAASKALINQTVDMIGWKLDIIDPNAIRFVGYNTTLLNESHVAFAKNPGFTFLYLGLNTARPPLNDPALRRAIANVLDKDLYDSIELKVDTDIADSVIVAENDYWFNASVPMYRVEKRDVGGRAEPVLDNVNAMLDKAGYFDRDNDGWREMPSGEDFNFTLFVPPVVVDSKKFVIGDSVKLNLWKVGLNVQLLERTEEEMEAYARSDAFDMYLSRYEVEEDPSFMFDLFHSSQLAAKNYANLQNSTLDSFLEGIREEINISLRRQRALDAQGWIAEEVPIAPLLHYKTIEAYDKTTFTGWVSMPGGINNFWSFLTLHLIQKGPLLVSVSTIYKSLQVEEEIDIAVSVTDQDQNSLEGVYILLDNNLGEHFEGITDSTGQFRVLWRAPLVQNSMTVTFHANAILSGYDNAQGSAQVTVHPKVRSFHANMNANNVTMPSKGQTFVNITVIDRETSSPVDNASVLLTISPSGIGESVQNVSGYTDSNGSFSTVFTASVSVPTIFKITAKISKLGYDDEFVSTSVVVSKHGGIPTGAPGIPSLETFFILLVVVFSALVYRVVRRPSRKSD